MRGTQWTGVQLIPTVDADSQVHTEACVCAARIGAKTERSSKPDGQRLGSMRRLTSTTRRLVGTAPDCRGVVNRIPLQHTSEITTHESTRRAHQHLTSQHNTCPANCTHEIFLATLTMASIARLTLLRQTPVTGQSLITKSVRATAFHTTSRRCLLPPLPRTLLATLRYQEPLTSC